MNGKLAQIGDLVVNPCVVVLRDMLAQAEAGALTTCAVIGITAQGQVATAYAGGQRGDLFVGTALISKRLLGEMEAPPAPRSSIIPARPVG